MDKLPRLICIYFFLLTTIGVWLVGDDFAYGETQKEEIVIGAHLPLTGILSQIGKEQKWAYEMAVADINREGGVFVGNLGKKLPVRLIVMDDQSSPAVVVSIMQKLITEYSVDFIFSGHTAVHGVIPGSIVAEINKKYYHATGGFIQPWKEHNFQWSTLLFVDMEALASLPFEVWQPLSETEQPERIALFMEDVYDGLAFSTVIQEKAAEFGYQVAIYSVLESDISDYSTFISKIKQEKVDTVLMYTSVADSINFIRQIKQSNIDLKYLFNWKGGWPAAFGELLGKDADKVLTDGHWTEEYPFTGARELGQRYRKDFGGPSASVGAFYAFAQVLWQAIENAGSLNPNLVRQAVLKGSFQTVVGTIDYDLYGVGTYPPIAFQWIDGKHEIIYPFHLAHKKVLAPFSVERKIPVKTSALIQE